MSRFFIIISLLLVSSVCADNVSKALDELSFKLTSTISEEQIKKRLAIIPFTDKTEKKSYGIAVSEYLVSAIQKSGKFILVDRADFNKTIMEIELSQTDMVSESEALEIGKVLTADYILTGTLSSAFGNIKVMAKIINTETTEIVASASCTLIDVSLDQFKKDLFSEKNQLTAAMFRSALIPGWGQIYAGKKARGAVSLSLFTGALGFSIASSIIKGELNSEYKDIVNDAFGPDLIDKYGTLENYESVKDAKYAEYQDSHDRAIISYAILGGVWGLNIIDAIIAGAQMKNNFKLYFSSGLETTSVGLAYCF